MFEADADPARRSVLTDEELYARLRPPATIVVRFGAMLMIGEFPYDGTAKPGCGTKLVVRSVRGTEIAEMLTTTCSNSGCSKTISRHEMLEYIENSGGKEYPFHEHGRVLRVATVEDLNRWSSLQARKPELLVRARLIAAPAALPMKIVDVEPIFGEEMTTIFYLSEERIDFRDLLNEFAHTFGTRIEMRQVGARDEARLVADYERCGQHCCCKNFLKVLKPISMKSAKVQKATLDPLKISGRCGRLMCCLRYEDETYADLQARMPKLKSRVGTTEGPGLVVDQKILVQLVLVRLEADGREIAVPVEELVDASIAERLAPTEGSPPAATRRAPRNSETAARPTRPDRPDQAARPDRTASTGRRGRRSREDGAAQPVQEVDPLRGMDPAQLERRLASRGGERDRTERAGGETAPAGAVGPEPSSRAPGERRAAEPAPAERDLGRPTLNSEQQAFQDRASAPGSAGDETVGRDPARGLSPPAGTPRIDQASRADAADQRQGREGPAGTAPPDQGDAPGAPFGRRRRRRRKR